MTEISLESQEILSDQINSQLRNLAELVQENHEAYKLCYQLGEHFNTYASNARLLATPLRNDVQIGGY